MRTCQNNIWGILKKMYKMLITNFAANCYFHHKFLHFIWLYGMQTTTYYAGKHGLILDWNSCQTIRGSVVAFNMAMLETIFVQWKITLK